MPEVRLTVKDKTYEGWKDIQIEQSIDAAAGAFRLSVSDRWSGQDNPWPIVEGDECTLSIDGEVVITGFVDRRGLSFGDSDHTFTVEGRDKTSLLVDCSVRLGHWEFLQQRVDKIVSLVCGQFGISVSIGQGIGLPITKDRFSVGYGETALEVIDRACRLGGVLAMPDTKGGLILTRPPLGKATTALIEGENIKSAVGDYDVTGRYRTYYAGLQVPGGNHEFGDDVVQVEGRAVDLGAIPGRTLLISVETNANIEDCKNRAAWEAAVRAARAGTASVTVQGWQQADGSLWPLGGTVRLTSPWLGIDSDMIIAARRMSLSLDEGTITSLALTRPGAYTPEPVIPQDQDPYLRDFSRPGP